MNREQLAWAGGFFAAEGNVRFQANSRKKYGALRLSIVQAEDSGVLKMFRRFVGVGKVRGPYGPYHGNRQPHWQYNASGFHHVQAVIAMLWGWLGKVKRRQARQALLEYRKYRRTLRYPAHVGFVRGTKGRFSG